MPAALPADAPPTTQPIPAVWASTWVVLAAAGLAPATRPVSLLRVCSSLPTGSGHRLAQGGN